MLELDPLKRISMKNALKNKYFDDILSQTKTMYEKYEKTIKKHTYEWTDKLIMICWVNLNRTCIEMFWKP